MKTIEQLMTEIEGHQVNAKIDIELVRASVRPSFEIAIREAKEGLAAATQEYANRIFQSSVGFFVQGDAAKSKEFAEVAKGVANVFVLDASAMYEKLADEVEPTVGPSREFNIFNLSHLQNALRDLATDTGLSRDFDLVSNGDSKGVQTRDDLVAHVRAIITESLGESLNAAVLRDRLIKQAIQARFAGNVLAAVILNANTQVRGALSNTFATKSDVAVEADTVVDEDFVLSVFRPTPKPKAATPPTEPKAKPKK